MSKQNFWIILLVGFVDHVGIGLVYPLFSILLFDRGAHFFDPHASEAIRGTWLGLLIALTPLTQFFTSSYLGAYSDRKGRKKALTIGLSIGVIGYALAVVGIFFESLFFLLLYRILVGFSDATIAVCQAAIADISEEKDKAKRFAYFSSSLGFGFTVGPFIGGILAETFNFAFPFIVAGSFCLFNYLLVLTKFPETNKQLKDGPLNIFEGVLNLRKIFYWTHLRAFLVGGFALGFGWAFFNEFAPLLLQNRFDFSSGEIGLYYAIGGITFAVGSSLGGFLLSKLSTRKLIFGSLALCIVSMLSFLHIQEGGHVYLLVIPLLVSLAIVFPTANALVSDRAGESQGEVLGAYHALISLSMGLSPLFLGSLVGLYPSLTSWGGSLALFLSALAFRSALNKEDRVAKMLDQD